MVPIRFWDKHLYVYKIVFGCWSLNFKCIFNVLHLSFHIMLASFWYHICQWFPTFVLSLPLLVNFLICNFLISNCGFFFSAERSSFSCCGAALEVLSSLSFCLSYKLLIFPSNLNESLCSRFIPFITLKISCHSLLPCRVSAEKNSALVLWGCSYMLFVAFFLWCLMFSFMYLIFISLISICLTVFLLGFILYVILCASSTWVSVSFPRLWKFLTNLFRYFLWPFLSLLLLEPLWCECFMFNVVPEDFQTLLSSFYSFFFFSVLVISATQSSTSLIHYSASIILILIPSSIFFIPDIVLFILLCAF